jgi:hypothetical protein
MAEGELCQAAARGGTCDDGADGRLDPAPSICSLTTMSPLQFQKQLRLHVARERMLHDGMDAASAAFEVGYESAS